MPHFFEVIRHMQDTDDLWAEHRVAQLHIGESGVGLVYHIVSYRLAGSVSYHDITLCSIPLYCNMDVDMDMDTIWCEIWYLGVYIAYIVYTV